MQLLGLHLPKNVIITIRSNPDADQTNLLRIRPMLWNFSTACIQNLDTPSRSKRVPFFIVTNHCSLFGLLTFKATKVEEITVAYLQ